MCPIETPEGPNIGLIVSLATYTTVNDYGFLETPYRKVKDGIVSKEIEYLSAIDEDRYYIAQASARINKEGNFLDESISCRHQGDYTMRPPEEMQYMDVSPKQIISVSASLLYPSWSTTTPTAPSWARTCSVRPYPGLSRAAQSGHRHGVGRPPTTQASSSRPGEPERWS